MRSKCPFLRTHPHLNPPPCQWIEINTENSPKEKLFCCKCCSQINKVDLEEVLEEKFQGSGVITILGIFFIVLGIILTTQPQPVHSPNPEETYSQQHK